MSVTFTSEVAASKTHTVVEPCLCSQFADCWLTVLDAAPKGRALTDAQVAELEAEASPDCPHCKGTGLEPTSRSTLPELNLCNANAYALLGALGLGSELWGEASVHEFRRGLIRAQNKGLSAWVREGYVLHGKPQELPDGSVELRPERVISGGLTEEGLRDRLARVSFLIEAHASAGATTITWG